MNFGRLLKSLSVGQLCRLFGIAIARPILFYNFIKATKLCISICTENFGNTHHKNNVANAFRHALWTALIISFSIDVGKSIKKSTAWAKFITDWHEETFKNSPLEKAMDLHNNKFGIVLAEKTLQQKEKIDTEKLVQTLLDEVKNAQQITTISAIQKHPKQLVFIEK
ncbi:DUF6973 domain-containing protein [Joostella sp. CR20]|uniref:DUF6973 domain-containing protein n=1 Tax=Joostella sp. CR20 TaxID=2804312 RepID=UPI00313BB041